MTKSRTWPALPFAEWADTYATLHMWTQIVGKTRLALAPMENHWWQIALYVTERGLTTSAMPCGDRTLAVEFDFVSHALRMRTSDGASHTLALAPRSVADFYAGYLDALRSLHFEPVLMGRPVEVETAIPFAKDHEHAAYDADAAHRCWQILSRADGLLKRFRSRFVGKQSPVRLPRAGQLCEPCSEASGCVLPPPTARIHPAVRSGSNCERPGGCGTRFPADHL